MTISSAERRRHHRWRRRRGGQNRRGEGFDTVEFTGSNIGVRADLAARIGQGGHAQGDVYISIEALTGTRFADELGGDEKDNVLKGMGGNDLLIGRA